MDKFCRNCGAPLNDRAMFCAQCGTPVNTASAGVEHGYPNAGGSAPAPASGSSSSYGGNIIGAVFTGAILIGLAFLPYAKLGPLSLSLTDSDDVWIYFVCVAMIAVADLIGKPILSLVGGAASVLFNLYEIGDAQEMLGFLSEALELSWGFWLIMFFSACAVLDGIHGLWVARNG